MQNSSSTTPISLIWIYDNVKTLKLDWSHISLLIDIERFDAEWSSACKKEATIFWDCHNLTSYDLFLERVKNIADLSESDINTGLNEIRFWYETEFSIQPLVRCLLFGFFIQQILKTRDQYSTLVPKAYISLLIEAGYTWVKYINPPLAYCLHINEWLSTILSSLRDQQVHLHRKLHLCGVRNQLSRKEVLLLHVIENNEGIKTTAISRKVGLSRATVKRMLKILREKRLIELTGINRAICYRVL